MPQPRFTLMVVYPGGYAGSVAASANDKYGIDARVWGVEDDGRVMVPTRDAARFQRLFDGSDGGQISVTFKK